jgi:hypothetical protein
MAMTAKLAAGLNLVLASLTLSAPTVQAQSPMATTSRGSGMAS